MVLHLQKAVDPFGHRNFFLRHRQLQAGRKAGRKEGRKAIKEGMVEGRKGDKGRKEGRPTRKE